MGLPILDLPADPRRRGEVHGEALREEIDMLYHTHVEYILGRTTELNRGIRTEADYQAFAARYVDPARRFSEDLWRECEGIAAGANMTPNQIMAQNLFLESLDLFGPYAPPLEGGCTSFAVRRKNGGAVVAQAYDMPRFYAPAVFVMRTHVEQTRLLALSIAGTVGACGMNDRGLGIVINKLFGTDNRVGVPYSFMVRRMLEMTSPGHALTTLLGADRASSINYILGHEEGVLLNIETTATGWEMLPEDGDFVYHTNHFVGTRGRAFEGRDFNAYGAHTLVRYARVHQLLRRIGGAAPLDAYADILCDRHNDPFGINSDSSSDDAIDMKTVATVVLEPAERKALFGNGSARYEDMEPVEWEA